MSFTRLRYHVVFGLKHRACAIDDKIEPLIYTTLQEHAESLDCRLIEVGGTYDHVHLVAAIRPSVAVSKFVSKLKAVSSGAVSREYPSHSGFAWQSGYGAFTLFPNQLEEVCEYVRHQKQHHGDGDLWEALEKMG
jgi:REP element-mobilizing transposase RayT